MSTDADALRFYVDESALGLGKALTAARKDTIHVGHALIPECPVGILDPDWMPIVAAKDLITIGRDSKIRTRPGERELLRENGLRVFRIGGRRDQSTWEWLCRFTKYWDAMEVIVAERPDGPWFYLVNSNGLVEVPLD